MTCALPVLSRLLLGILVPASLVAASLEADFRDPPVAARPYVWWHWMGANISTEGITKDLEAMKASGIGGATIFNVTSGVMESQAPIRNLPWPDRGYRSPAYWECLHHAAAEAKRLGLELGLHNTVGYSTTGGPWIRQEQGMLKVLWSETAASGGNPLALDLPRPQQRPAGGWGGVPRDPVDYYRDIAVFAVPKGVDPVPPDRLIDLSSHMDAQGRLQWNDPPPGNWTILRLGCGPTASTPHPVPDELIGKVREADKMDAETTRFHWHQVLDPLREHLGPLLGDSFRHVLIDSYEAGPQNWTADMRAAFTRRYGYDPAPWLVARTPTVRDGRPAGPSIGSADMTARFERDLREFIAERFQRDGWEVAQGMIHDARLTLQMEPYGQPFDTVAGAAAADLPMGEFWSHGGGDLMAAAVAPAARAAGRRIIGAESFTGKPENSRFSETPAALARSTLGAFASGANRLVLHYWVHQPLDDRFVPGLTMGWWGTHFGRLQTWFEPGKAFFAYLGRAQVLLQHGETVVDTVSVGRAVERSDVIPMSVFLADARVEEGRIVLPSGRRYALLIVPHDGALLPEAVRRIRALLADGATIVAKPATRSPSLAGYPGCDDEVRALSAALWAPGAQARLFTETGPALAALHLADDVIVQGAAKDIRVVHRRADDADIYFVANATRQRAEITLSLRDAVDAPELWNAEDGSRTPAVAWRMNGQRMEIDAAVPGVESRFIVVRRGASPAVSAPAPVRMAATSGRPELAWDAGILVVRADAPATATVTFGDGATRTVSLAPAPAVAVEGPWPVAFSGPGTSGGTVVLPALASWAEHADPQVRYASGTATYRRDIAIPAAWLADHGRVALDLGEVHDLAAVTLNGTPLGVLWKAPFRLDLTPAARAGDNRLEIAVTNTWHNRLVGDEQEPADIEWGAGRPQGRPLAAFPDWIRTLQARPSAARRCFVTWNYMTRETELLPAGLLGPVRLVPGGQAPIPAR